MSGSIVSFLKGDSICVNGYDSNGHESTRYFKLAERLGSGSFGEIWECFNPEGGNEKDSKDRTLAVKFESPKLRPTQLMSEAKLYMKVGNSPGFPEFVLYGTVSDANVVYNCLVMEKLGPNLEDLFHWCNSQFSVKTTLMLGEQMLARIETLHNIYYMHRDIKPDNFLMGERKKSNVCYMIDFGLIKQFMDPKTKVHIPWQENKGLTGTARYASINAQKGNEQGRRDDLEALGYLFVYLLRGGLPWQGIQAKTKKEKYEKMLEIKMAVPPEQLCKGCPDGFFKYVHYCRKLSFTAIPEYHYLKYLLSATYEEFNLRRDFRWDWYDFANKPSKTIPKNLVTTLGGATRFTKTKTN